VRTRRDEESVYQFLDGFFFRSAITLEENQILA